MATKLKLDLLVDDQGSAVIKSFGSKAQGAFNVAKTGAVGLGVGLAGATAGIYAMNRVMSEAVGLANVQEKSEQRLAGVLEATGYAAGYNLEQLKKMAGAMQDSTAVGDEVILSGMAILGTFKNVSKEGFERATQAAMDMSAVMAGSGSVGDKLEASMMQVGKAINDPIKGISMLTRVGVTFSDEQKRQIQILQESGDLYGAQAVMLQELESEFGGTAKTMRETFGGSVTAAQNTLGDMKEELGFVITKNQFFIDLVKLAEKEFVTWGGYIRDNRKDLQELAKSGIVAVVGGIETAMEVMRFFHNGWLGLKLVGSVTTEVLATGLHVLYEGLRIALFPLDELFKALVKIGTMDSNPFDGLSQGLKDFSYSSGDVVDQVKADMVTVNATYDSVKNKVGSMKKAIEAIPVTSAKSQKAQVKDLKEIAKVVGQTEKEKAKDRKAAEKEAEKDRKAAKRAEEQAIKDRVNAYQSMYGDLKWDAKGFYDYKVKLLKAEAQEYLNKTGDEELAEQWLTAQMEALNDQRVQDHKEAEYEKLMASDDFFGGYRAGLDQLMADHQTWAQVGVDLAETMTDSMADSFSDFINPLSDEFGNLESLVNSVFESMVQAAADAVARMAVEWAIAEGMSFLDNIFHTGNWNVGPDEVAAILQQGEIVFDKETADKIRDTFGTPQNFQQHLETVAGGGTGFENTAQKSAVEAMAKAAGFNAVQAAVAMGTGTATPSQAFSALFSSTALGNIATAGVTELTSSALGLSSVGNITSAVAAALSALGMATFGPAGAVVGNIAGKELGELVGDITNTREDEAIKDYLEDKRGWVAAHQLYDYASAVDLAQAQYDADYGLIGGYYGGSGYGYNSEDPTGWGKRGYGNEGYNNYGGGGDGGGYGGIGGTGTDQGDQGDTSGWLKGGISRGSKSGHMELLHGDEAVVPLPDGRAIPVRIEGGGGQKIDLAVKVQIGPQEVKDFFVDLINNDADVNQALDRRN